MEAHKKSPLGHERHSPPTEVSRLASRAKRQTTGMEDKTLTTVYVRLGEDETFSETKLLLFVNIT